MTAMLLNEDLVYQIEDGLVRATLQPEAWPDVVAQVVSASGARGAAVLPLRGRAPGVPLSPSCEELIDAYFREGWVKHDHRMIGVERAMRSGLLVDQDISTPEFMRKNPYYTDFLGRFGFRWFIGLLVEAGEDAWGFSLQRTAAQGPFTPDEQTAMRRLIAPLARTMRLAQNMSETRLRSIADTLDALRVPGLLIDRSGRVVRYNRLAEPHLGRAFDLTKGRIVIRQDRGATARVRAHVEAAIWSRIRPDDPALRPVSVGRWGQPPLIFSAQPLRKVGFEYLDGARAILTIKDLDRGPPPSFDLLRSLYGLTAREAEMCEVLLSGRRVGECARELGVSLSTARTHLKSIFLKTDTSRQSELLMLLSRHAAI